MWLACMQRLPLSWEGTLCVVVGFPVRARLVQPYCRGTIYPCLKAATVLGISPAFELHVPCTVTMKAAFVLYLSH